MGAGLADVGAGLLPAVPLGSAERVHPDGGQHRQALPAQREELGRILHGHGGEQADEVHAPQWEAELWLLLRQGVPEQIEFWKWLAKQKEHGLTAGSTAQISRTRVEYCTAFLNYVGELQFGCCEREEDRKYGVLEKQHQDQLKHAKVEINNLFGEQDMLTQDSWNHTKGKDLSIEQMRALQAVTAVSWVAAGKARGISRFMLLGLQALALHCWMQSRRTVFSRTVKMSGLSMNTFEVESAALDDVSGTCHDSETPLIVYRLVGCRDKGHGGDMLITGVKTPIYKCAPPRPFQCADAGLGNALSRF